MPSNKFIRVGPVALTANTVTNIFNPPTLTGGTGLAGTNANTYVVLRHVRVVNKTNAAATFALWLGATGANAAGTEVISGAQVSANAITNSTGVVIPGNSYFDYYGQLRLDAADYLVGAANAATTLTLEAEGEIGIV